MHENPCVTIGFNCVEEVLFSVRERAWDDRDKGGDFTAARDGKSDYEAGIGLNDGDRRPCHPRPPASGFPTVESAHQDAKIEFGDMDSDSVCGRSRVRAAMPVACRRDPASELDQLAAPAHGLASDPGFQACPVGVDRSPRRLIAMPAQTALAGSGPTMRVFHTLSSSVPSFILTILASG